MWTGLPSLTVRNVPDNSKSPRYITENLLFHFRNPFSTVSGFILEGLGAVNGRFFWIQYRDCTGLEENPIRNVAKKVHSKRRHDFGRAHLSFDGVPKSPGGGIDG